MNGELSSPGVDIKSTRVGDLLRVQSNMREVRFDHSRAEVVGCGIKPIGDYENSHYALGMIAQPAWPGSLSPASRESVLVFVAMARRCLESSWSCCSRAFVNVLVPA